MKEKSKKVGKYLVYLWEHYDSYYSSRGAGKVMKGKFDYGEVAVFVSGKEKSLQRSETELKSKSQANALYRKLSSIDSIEKWVAERGY